MPDLVVAVRVPAQHLLVPRRGLVRRVAAPVARAGVGAAREQQRQRADVWAVVQQLGPGSA